MSITQVSLFSGIGGFDLGFELAGFESVLQCEIDPAPVSVLKRWWPEVEKVNDVKEVGAGSEREFRGRSAPQRCESNAATDGRTSRTGIFGSPTVIHFGSPCQDLSVAGKRAGLAGERSGLFHEAIRVVRTLRPEFAIWENVEGSLSSNNGRDFGVVLDEMAKAGAMDVAWRVLDAQWFGLAQRRRRVFVVADFRGHRAGEILLEPEGVPRNPPTRRKAGQGVAAPVGGGATGAGRSSEKIGEQVTLGIFGGNRRADRPDGGFYVKPMDVSKTLDSDNGLNPSASQGGMAVIAAPIAAHHPRTDLDNETYVVRTAQTGANGHGVANDVTHTLDGADGQAVYVPEVVGAHHGGGLNGQDAYSGRVFSPGQAVRRLTPRECERLQGFPDDWTRYRSDGSEISDSARYKMLGNAVPPPFANWLAWRMRYAMETA